MLVSRRGPPFGFLPVGGGGGGGASSLLQPLVDEHLDHHLGALVLRVLHADLDAALGGARVVVVVGPAAATAAAGSVIQEADIPARDDLSEPAVDGVPDLDVGALLADEDQVHALDEAGLLGLAHVVHDHGPRHFAVFVDV